MAIVDSPYTRTPTRLGDVIAAIQALGTYRYYKRTFEGWATRISGDKTQAAHWEGVLRDHPEFFRVSSDGKHASLVWRRQYPRRWHVDTGRRLTQDEIARLEPKELERLSRDPLSAAEIQTLLSTASDLHARGLEQKSARRWWIPVVVNATAALVGAGFGALVGRFLR